MLIRAYFENGYPACNEEKVFHFTNDTTEEEIEDYLFIVVMDWAEEQLVHLGYLGLDRESEMTDSEYDEYYENVCYTWQVCDMEDDL